METQKAPDYPGSFFDCLIRDNPLFDYVLNYQAWLSLVFLLGLVRGASKPRPLRCLPLVLLSELLCWRLFTRAVRWTFLLWYGVLKNTNKNQPGRFIKINCTKIRMHKEKIGQIVKSMWIFLSFVKVPALFRAHRKRHPAGGLSTGYPQAGGLSTGFSTGKAGGLPVIHKGRPKLWTKLWKYAE